MWKPTIVGNWSHGWTSTGVTELTKCVFRVGEAYPSLALPESNPYIATDFELIERGAEMAEPSLLVQCPKYNLWYMQDHEFETPTAIM
jgi:secreted Zn-dependent insulinase-like peptidase